MNLEFHIKYETDGNFPNNANNFIIKYYYIELNCVIRSEL